MTEKRFENKEWVIYDSQTYDEYHCDFFAGLEEITDLLNEQQEQLDLYKEAILTMLGLLADKGIIFSGVKDE